MNFFVRVLPLFTMIVLGVFAGRFALFGPNRNPQAISVLNRFALYIAFPLLIITSLAQEQESQLTLGFVLVHILAFVMHATLCYLIAALFPNARRERHAITFASLFGNIAYLGIPFAAAVLGEHVMGLASLSAAIHIVLGMSIGPFILLRGAHREAPSTDVLRKLIRQPLLWAPFIGIGLSLVQTDITATALAMVAPIGRAAGPVALFMLGLYLYEERTKVAQPDISISLTCILKLGAYPCITFLAASWIAPWWSLSHTSIQVAVLVAAMPVAISTFSLAEEFETGQRLTARAIVLTTAISLVTLSIWAQQMAES